MQNIIVVLKFTIIVNEKVSLLGNLTKLRIFLLEHFSEIKNHHNKIAL